MSVSAKFHTFNGFQLLSLTLYLLTVLFPVSSKGRSNVVDVLYDKGFRDIYAVDISAAVVLKMQHKYSSYAGVVRKRQHWNIDV